jgi:formylmethanofuran dehydrogenase subunit B
MDSPGRGGSSEPSQHPHVTCLGCGCACDDIVLTVEGSRIAAAEHACELGLAWFGDGWVPGAVRVDGRDTDFEQALRAAAALLETARGRLLVFLSAGLTSEAQGALLGIADRLGGTVDGQVSDTAAAGILAGQRRGRATATLGEIRNRADLVVFWGVDPELRYPRYRSRYATSPTGLHLRQGHPNRTVVSVSVGSDAGPAEADLQLALAPTEEIGALAELRAQLLGRHLGAEAGLPAGLADLAARLGRAKYVAIVHDGEPTAERRSPDRAEGLVALAQALNGPTRAALSTLRAGGNRSGAEAITTWQTGFPFAVDFSRGAPRYHPERRGTELLAAGVFAAALVGGSAERLSESVAAGLAAIPTVAVGPRASEAPFAPRIAIDTGVAGIHEAGLGYRMDEVPLPLRGVVPGPRSARDTLARLAAQLSPAAAGARA